MRDYVITTDSSADLPKDFLEKKDIGCVYLSYIINGETYTNKNALPVQEFYATMRGGAMPTTAQVNPEAGKALFEPYLKEGKDILHIAFSSGLSGTYNSCRIAAEELMEDYPDRKIIVIDSLAASMGQGLLVYLAMQRKDAGEDLEANAAWVEAHKNNIAHIFTVDDLNHLYRGGRISKATAVVGSVLNIKPILRVDEEGRLVSIGKARGRKRLFRSWLRLWTKKSEVIRIPAIRFLSAMETVRRTRSM